MNKKVGLPPELVDRTNRHLSSGTVGEFFPGTQLDAIANGAMIGFTSCALLAYVDSTAGTKAPALKTAATAGSGTGTLEEYMILGEKGFWRNALSSVTAAGVTTSNGIYNTITGSPYSRGIYKLQLGDVNNASTSILDNDANVFLPVGDDQDWEVEFGIAATTNTSQAATVGFVECGVVGGATDDDPANAIGTYYAEFKIAASLLVCKTETTANVKTIALPSGFLKLNIRYVGEQGKFYFYINGDYQGSASAHASMSGAQCFVRASHLAAYTAATHAPISADVDYIIANGPLMEHRA